MQILGVCGSRTILLYRNDIAVVLFGVSLSWITKHSKTKLKRILEVFSKHQPLHRLFFTTQCHDSEIVQELVGKIPPSKLPWRFIYHFIRCRSADTDYIMAKISICVDRVTGNCPLAYACGLSYIDCRFSLWYSGIGFVRCVRHQSGLLLFE